MILNWNSWESTRDRALEIAAWSRLRPDLWVIDNGSTGDEAELLRAALPAARVVEAGGNLGFGGGNNLALRRIETPFTLLVNQDAGLGEESALRLLELLERRPDAAVVGPALTDRAGRLEALGGRDIGRYVRTHHRPPASEERTTRAESAGAGAGSGDTLGGTPREVAYVPGTAALLRTDAVRQVGCFDERFFFSGEMADLCRRLADRGWRCIVVPSALAWHDRSLGRRNRDAFDSYYSLRNRFLYLSKHPAPGRRWAWALYGAASGLRHLLLGHPRRARAEVLAVADGLRGRFGRARRDLER